MKFFFTMPIAVAFQRKFLLNSRPESSHNSFTWEVLNILISEVEFLIPKTNNIGVICGLKK
jgi:hypothetical protein